MQPKFFGRYLVEKGYITDNQLSEAVAYQMSRVKKVGEIAVDNKYMTENQVRKVLNEQMKKDLLFGQLATSLGFITADQLENALSIQKNNHIFLGEVLVEKKMLSKEKLDRQLRLFLKEHKPIENIENLIPTETVFRDEIAVLLDISVKMFRRVASLHLKPGTGSYREKDVRNLFLISAVNFSGAIDLHFFLNMSENVAYALTRNCYSDKTSFETDEIVDCIGELTNAICGNATPQIHKLKHLLYKPPVRMLRSETPTWSLKDKQQLIFPASLPLPDGIIEIGVYHGSY